VEAKKYSTLEIGIGIVLIGSGVMWLIVKLIAFIIMISVAVVETTAFMIATGIIAIAIMSIIGKVNKPLDKMDME
jgi:hypothetical protein